MTVYKRSDEPALVRPLETPGPVLAWEGPDGKKEIVFSCPCGEREVYVRETDGHAISFGEDGELHIEQSCGSAARPGRRANWCHFWIHGGYATMVKDSICPGKK